LRILYGHHVLNVFHHADDARIATRIATDGTRLVVTDIVAHATMPNLLLHAGNGFRKPYHVLVVLPQQVQHQSQGRLAPDAW
jgi:riboflavin synthase